MRYPADNVAAHPAGSTAPPTAALDAPEETAALECCGTRALFGWSPPPLPADTALKRRVDRVLPRSGLRLIFFFAVIVALLNVGPLLPQRLDLAAVGLASLAAGSWCSVNFWRCRHAHCVITGSGWLALAGFAFVEAALGRSVIHGDEGLVFLGVLGAGLVVEAVWCSVRGTNVMSRRSTKRLHASG